jgi:hypothetical protein
MPDSAEPRQAPSAPRTGNRRRTIAVVIGAVVVALALAAILAAVIPDRSGTPKEFFQADKVGDPVRSIGPLKGADLTSYIKSRQKALASTDGSRVAVISLDRYTTEREARSAVGNTEVVALIAAPQGGAPSVVDRDLKTWADQQREAAKTERDEFQRLLPTVDSAEFKAEYQADITRLSALIDRVSPTGSVVFAVAVRAPSQRLKQLAKSPGIRLVDVGSSDKVGDKPTYHGVRPEETANAGDPDTRPL